MKKKLKLALVAAAPWMILAMLLYRAMWREYIIRYWFSTLWETAMAYFILSCCIWLCIGALLFLIVIFCRDLPRTVGLQAAVLCNFIVLLTLTAAPYFRVIAMFQVSGFIEMQTALAGLYLCLLASVFRKGARCSGAVNPEIRLAGRKWWVWLVYILAICGDMVLYGVLYSNLRYWLYRLNDAMFHSYGGNDILTQRYGNYFFNYAGNSDPLLVQMGNFFIPILVFFALAILVHVLLKLVDRRLVKAKRQ